MRLKGGSCWEMIQRWIMGNRFVNFSTIWTSHRLKRDLEFEGIPCAPSDCDIAPNDVYYFSLAIYMGIPYISRHILRLFDSQKNT